MLFGAPLLAALAGATIIGATLGLLGGGGTILTVPLVQAVLGLDTRHAVALSLPIVATAAATGVFIHWRAGTLEPLKALTIALMAAAGAYVGASIGRSLTPRVQALLLAITLVTAAVVMWSRRDSASASERPAVRALALWPLGFCIGILTGLVGVGGGFLVVPALVALGGYSPAAAVRASLVVITCSATSAAFGYRSVSVPWATVAVMALAASSGVAAGTLAGRRIPPRVLNRLFPIGLLVAAIYVAATR